MKAYFYNVIVRLTRLLGPWFFVLISWGIAAGYFFFFPRRVAVSRHFYEAVFPGRSPYYYLWCTWKQYQNFTSVYLDRFIVTHFDDITYTSHGWEHIEAAMGTTGGIILMSHVGNWDVAAHLMKRKRPHINLLLYIGEREKEEIEGLQKEDLQDSGIKVVTIDQKGSSAFEALSGIQFLKSGGIVSMTGDKVWNEAQRTISVEFFGCEVQLPEFPYVFAILSGAPLFVFFTFRTGKRKYRLTLSRPIYIQATSREKRPEAIRKSAQRYADLLQETVCERPFEWYHFEPFLGPKLKENRGRDRPLV